MAPYDSDELEFDAELVDPTDTFTPLPPGDYTVRVDDAMREPTKDSTGQMLTLRLQVVGGPYANRLLFDRLNLWNRSQQAVEIAQRTLSQICHAIGILKLKKVSDLLTETLFVAHVGIDKNNPEYNRVKGYSPAGGAPPKPAARQATAAAATAPADPTTPPWARRAGRK